MLAEACLLTMIIDLASIRGDVKSIDTQLDPSDIDVTDEPFSIENGVDVAGELLRTSLGVEFRGKVTADVSIDCSRCLTPVRRHLDIPFRTVFIEADRAESEADRQLDEDQLDETTAEDGRADLAELAREQILLAIPEQIFCSDDCQGICPKCGGNLNLIDCKCADVEIDPRWAALKDLR